MRPINGLIESASLFMPRPALTGFSADDIMRLSMRCYRSTVALLVSEKYRPNCPGWAVYLCLDAKQSITTVATKILISSTRLKIS